MSRHAAAQGEALVSKLGEDKQEMAIGKLNKGDYFGEAALINASKRGATVTAQTDMQVGALDDIFSCLVLYLLTCLL